MKKYCLDTSGFSNPHEFMPEDIHVTLWGQVTTIIPTGVIATTPEIYDELTHIQGSVGEVIRSNRLAMVLEVGDLAWPFNNYIGHNSRMLLQHHDFISEYTGGSSKTVCINDITVCALAKALSLPLISSEKPCSAAAVRKRKIPDVCSIEQVAHMTFNDFLRAEGIRA